MKNLYITYTSIGLFLLSFALTHCAKPQDDLSNPRRDDVIYWQAHRGGGAHDAPDNTLGAFLYTWNLGGIPEADLRTTKDGVIICLHDKTLERTTTAPKNINKQNVNELYLDDIQKWDAGITFSQKFKGEQIPTLAQVFSSMSEKPERQIYLDIKDVDLKQLGALIDKYAVNKQILIASPRQSDCKTLRAITKNVRTMIWIGGSAEEIKEKFNTVAASNFAGVDQVQLHLNDKKETNGWRYQLDVDFVKHALSTTTQAGIDLEVFPFKFKESNLHVLLDMGIRWYATDEPARFKKAITNWLQAESDG